MWQLLFNGLNVAGSLASLGSVASGFSLEKDVDRIQAALQRLESLHADLLNSSRASRVILDDVAPIISGFGNLRGSTQQDVSANSLEHFARSISRDLTETTRSILDNAVAEMRAALGAVHFVQSPALQSPHNLLRRLVGDPYDAGITKLWDISEGGLWARDKPLLVNPMLAPVTWANPLTGQAFLGQMPLARLRQFGVDLHPPKYPHTTDGLIFSEQHGLYLPSTLVVIG